MNDTKTTADLIQRLHTKAAMLEMGERISWGSDSSLMREAADALGRAVAAADWALREPEGELTDVHIKAICIYHGFTIKEGLDDLKPYVYAAARACIAADRTLRPAGDAAMPVIAWLHDWRIEGPQEAALKKQAVEIFALNEMLTSRERDLADAQAALAAKDREISILNAQLVSVKAIASGNLELLDTVTAKDAEIAALRQALQEIRALENTESDEWDAVERVIPEMVGIACAAIAQAAQPTKGKP